MNRLLAFVAILSLILTTQIFAQQNFQRVFEIPTATYEEGRFGGIIAGVDFDGDGWPEIYACNTNMIDRPGELIPRLYKFEWNGSEWEMVWSTSSEVPEQNTWPALAWGDLDQDGKPEIYWGPVNYLNATTNPNPDRILVYEYPGDGSDNMGVDDGFGGFLPNATTTLTSDDMLNLRPIRFVIADIDNDGDDELIFSDRGSSEWHFGVVSVDDIPDDGSGLETWTIEANGLGDINLTGTGAKWDLAVLNNYIYLFDGVGQVFPVRFQGGVWESLEPQAGLAGELSSFKGSVVVDIDGDGNDEIVVGGWFGGAKVHVLRQFADTLQSFEIADLSGLGGWRLNGAAFGDLDGNGNVDFVFGSRHDALNSVNNPLFRVSYLGGDITSAANYESSMIDSLLLETGGDLDVVVIANIDGDAADEVLYTQGYTRGNPTDEPANIAILDLNWTPPVSVEKENSGIPSNFYVEQNYPNPFNPSTVIKFGITEATNVDLRVFDVLGREVAVLVNNQNLEAGSYTANFNAEGLASGIYIYRINAGNNTTSMKMQLLK
ncbi:MAG: T9SS type A sorting domain-containing protein [Ignavibacteriaceae bacterium]